MKTQIFEKKGKLSSEKTIVAFFFLVISSVTNLKGHFVRGHMLFWQLL